MRDPSSNPHAVRRSRGHLRRRGVITVYVALTSLVLIPVAGMAIDFSVLYNVKARLQAAVDAATVAAGETLQRTTKMKNAAQIASVKATAQAFFNANYPAGFWGSTQAYYVATTAVGANQVRSIQVRVGETVP